MRMRINWNILQKYNKLVSDEYKRKSAILISNIDKIKNHAETEKINYPTYKESFDYVDDFSPSSKVKNVTLYLCSGSLLKDLGYSGVGGFFERILKTVVINKNMSFEGDFVGKITTDEAIVHELLHYVSDISDIRKSVKMEEEFAYSNSVPYLRDKGYFDAEIIDNNFLPYLSGLVNTRKVVCKILVNNGRSWEDFLKKNEKTQDSILKEFDGKIRAKIKEEAKRIGQDIINVFDRRNKKVDFIWTKSDEVSFEFMEF